MSTINVGGGANLGNMVGAELELRRRRRANEQLVAPDDWRSWCTTLFPRHFSREFAPHHENFWEWVEGIELGVPSPAYIAIWGRGDAKSTSVETACVKLGSKKARKYALYVSSTQVKADGHVQSIGAMLESKPYANYYHKMSRHAVNQYGASKGWKHNRLITASGFAVDAFGLDSGLRGAKIEEARPDLIIFDDVDEKFDSPATVMKKIQTITETIMPSGSDDCVYIFVQNLIHPDSIASRLSDNRADFLRNRVFVGVIPAFRNLVTEYDTEQNRYIVISGEPTWPGRTLEDAQKKMDDWGPSAYLKEAQHEVKKRDGIWSQIHFAHIKYEDLPVFDDVAVWIDPAVTSTEDSACQGISCGGKTGNKLVGLFFWEGITTPLNAMIMAIEKGYEWGASHVGVETDQGGDTWESVYKEACRTVQEKMQKAWLDAQLAEDPDFVGTHEDFILPKFTSDKASWVRKRAGMSVGSKMERNSRMLLSYERGSVSHMLGTHTTIEEALYRIPLLPWDLADSWWWTWFDLIGQYKEKVGAR